MGGLACRQRALVDNSTMKVLELLEHVFETDDGDSRFKTCIYCGAVQYRTDDELLERIDDEQ